MRRREISALFGAQGLQSEPEEPPNQTIQRTCTEPKALQIRSARARDIRRQRANRRIVASLRIWGVRAELGEPAVDRRDERGV
jgi:hypothetical protein